MAFTLSDDQLPALLESLQGDLQAFNIRGEIRCKLNSVITDFEFIVDRWPDYNVLVGRVNPTTAKGEDRIGNRSVTDPFPSEFCPTSYFEVHLERMIMVYAKDNTILETFLQRPGVIKDWSKSLVFVDVSPCTTPVVENVLHRQQRPYYADDHFIFTATNDTLKHRPVPDGCKIIRLRPDQAHIVCTYWHFGKGKGSEMYLRHVLEHRNSCCLYNEEGDIVGFAVQYHNSSLGMLYVLEEHRGRGYGKVIMSHLAHMSLQSESVVYALVSQKNTRSVELHECIGFKKTSEFMCTQIWVNV